MISKDRYQPVNQIRIVTATSLYDGHDAAINVMRRIIQSTGAEVIHLGHNRSVKEIVDCAIQEDAQAVAVTSYQGGHIEFFTYMYDLLKEGNCGHIKIFGGGGGVILPDEMTELHDYGIARIYSPDDGREMGLQGMINDLLKQADFPSGKDIDVSTEDIKNKDIKSIARAISAAENYPANILVGSSLSLLNGKTPAANGNSPGTFSFKFHFNISPQPSYFGRDIFGICKCDNDSVCVAILNSLSLTLKIKYSSLKDLTLSFHPSRIFLLRPSKSSSISL